MWSAQFIYFLPGMAAIIKNLSIFAQKMFEKMSVWKLKCGVAEYVQSRKYRNWGE